MDGEREGGWQGQRRVNMGRIARVETHDDVIKMEIFSALLALCAGNSPVTGEFNSQRPVTRSFDVFFDLRLIKRLSIQSWCWWFETPSPPLWRHCNAEHMRELRIPWCDYIHVHLWTIKGICVPVGCVRKLVYMSIHTHQYEWECESIFLFHVHQYCN